MTDSTTRCPCGAPTGIEDGLAACPACGGWRVGAPGDSGPLEPLASLALARLPATARGPRLVDARRLPFTTDPAAALAAAAAHLGADGLLLLGLLAARGDALSRADVEARLATAGLDLVDLEVDRAAGAGAALARTATPRAWLAWLAPGADLEAALSASAVVRVALGAPSASVVAVVPGRAAPFFELCPAVRAGVAYDPARLRLEAPYRAAVMETAAKLMGRIPLRGPAQGDVSGIGAVER
jgi:hypothetical protein